VIGEVRDRLADFIAAGTYPQVLQEKLSYSLKAIAFLKAEVSPVGAEISSGSRLSLLDEERLLDFDLVLLDKVAALHSQIDQMEAAAAPDAILAALDLFDEGLAEVDDFFQERRLIFKGTRG